MSAFFVTDKTIADAVQCMKQCGFEAEDMGRDLWRLNVMALGQRYGYPAEKFESDIEAYESPVPSGNPYQILKSTNCLIYQCSEGNVPDLPLYMQLEQASEALSLRLGRPDRGFPHTDRDSRYDSAEWDRNEDVPGEAMRP